MTQPDAKPDIDTQLILQSVIHAIAEEPTSQETILLILQHSINIALASAGVFIVHNEAEILVSHNISVDELTTEDVANSVREYTDDVYVGTDIPSLFGDLYQGWIVIPINQDGEHTGSLILLYQGAVEFDINLGDVMGSLVDSLRMIAYTAYLKGRHKRHNLNQHEFLRVVTHDMRSPLTSMHGFGSMLESQMVGDLNEKQARFVEKIMSGIAQLTIQIDNMQDAGRYDPETGFYEMSRSATDLIELVRTIATNSLLPTEKQNLQLSFDADDNVPIINVDSAMLERSVTNLIDNAIKYTPDGENINVSVRHDDDDAIMIAVEDSGFGINPENIDKLFNRHFRIHRQEHRRVKGSGLGLFIVRSVAIKHNGDAWVESVEGEGSTFFIRIPLSDDNLLGSG
jgi:signal transduction histidine kinase